LYAFFNYSQAPYSLIAVKNYAIVSRNSQGRHFTNFPDWKKPPITGMMGRYWTSGNALYSSARKLMLVMAANIIFKLAVWGVYIKIIGIIK
jgi:hypothetical protein